MAPETNAPISPKAQIHVPASRVQVLDQPSDDGGAAKRIQVGVPGLDDIRQFEGDDRSCAGSSGHLHAGHTPGHTSYHVGSGNQQLIVLGDVTNMPRAES